MARQIRILMITARADFGGGPEHIYRLAGKLSERIKVYMAAPDDYPYYSRFSDMLGSDKIIKIPHRKFTVGDLLRLQDFIRKNKIDLIHSHGKGAGIYSRMLYLLTGKPVVHTFHGIHIDRYNERQAKLYIWLERFLGTMTRAFISVSHGEYEKMKKLNIAPLKKISVIENGAAVPDDVVSENIVEQKPLNILTVTRFDFAKNSMLLIPIAEEMLKFSGSDSFRFVIVGKGEEEELFKKEVEQKGISSLFIFAGTTENISKYYLSSFCYISTSKGEGLPLAVMEAMGCGVPVIATDVVGNNDLIENGKTGFLYSVNEPAKAALLITELKKNIGLWKSVSAASAEKIKTNYSVESMARQTEKLYFNVIERQYID